MGVSFAALAGPPFVPPSAPRATATGLFFAVDSSKGVPSMCSPIAFSTTLNAFTAKSRSPRFGIPQVYRDSLAAKFQRDPVPGFRQGLDERIPRGTGPRLYGLRVKGSVTSAARNFRAGGNTSGPMNQGNSTSELAIMCSLGLRQDHSLIAGHPDNKIHRYGWPLRQCDLRSRFFLTVRAPHLDDYPTRHNLPLFDANHSGV